MNEPPPLTAPLERTTPLPGVAELRFGNAPHGCFDEASEAAFDAALDVIDAETDTRVVVLAGGVPGVFVRHYDVGVLEARGRAPAARGLRFDVARPVPEAPIHRCLRRIADSARICVAAIDGVAMGGGCEIALACDLRIAADGDYPIGLPDVNIGLLPGDAGMLATGLVRERTRFCDLLVSDEAIARMHETSQGRRTIRD